MDMIQAAKDPSPIMNGHSEPWLFAITTEYHIPFPTVFLYREPANEFVDSELQAASKLSSLGHNRRFHATATSIQEFSLDRGSFKYPPQAWQ